MFKRINNYYQDDSIRMILNTLSLFFTVLYSIDACQFYNLHKLEFENVKSDQLSVNSALKILGSDGFTFLLITGIVLLVFLGINIIFSFIPTLNDIFCDYKRRKSLLILLIVILEFIVIWCMAHWVGLLILIFAIGLVYHKFFETQ